METNRILLFDTTQDFSDDEYMYKEFCESYEYDGIEAPSINSDEYNNWWHECLNDSVECFFENLKSEKKLENNQYFVIQGTLGLWNGNHIIAPVMCYELDDAIKNVFRNCEDVSAYLINDSYIEIECYHHDGTNKFTIKPLTKFGFDIFSSDRNYKSKSYENRLYKKCALKIIY